jgi:branched-chain amino acid transport system permease protein
MADEGELNLQVDWVTFIRLGLLGGLGAVYVSAVGMVEAFAQRNLVGTFLNLGMALLLTGPFITGYLTAKEIKSRDYRKTLPAAAAAGFFAGLPNILLIIIGTVTEFGVREIFVNISPALVDLITFNNAAVIGSILFILVSIVTSVFAAVLYILPDRVRWPIVNGLLVVLIVGVFTDTFSQILNQTFGLFGQNLGRFVVRLFFRGQSLIPISALVLFLLVAAVTYFRHTRAAAARATYETMSPERQKTMRWVMLLLAIGLVLTLPLFVGSFLSHVLFLVGLYILMGLGLNIVVGFAGLLDLGYVAFFAFGAYTMGVLTSTTEIGVSGLNFWLALPVCVLVAVFFGILLGFPVLRMRGDYLAITTLGFGEIIRILAVSDWLRPYFGGAQGILAIPSPTLGPINFNTPQAMYYIVIFGALLAGFIAIRLRDSRLGRQWMAMREDEDVAEAMGINLVTTKLMAFAIGAGFSGLSGAIFASRVGTIFPNSFGLLVSINVLALIIVGGMGSIPGVIVGSFILVGMPELLREFSEYRLLMYGILLIIMMLTRPEGFIPAETIKRELHADEEVEGPAHVEVSIRADIPKEAGA